MKMNNYDTVYKVKRCVGIRYIYVISKETQLS